jgi:hypothetical protein
MITNKELVLQVGFTVFGTFVGDTIFHALATEPFETALYFVIKMVISIVLGLMVYRRGLNRLAAALIFTAVFSIYYRSLELILGIPFGARVPDIVLGSKRLTNETNPLLSTFVWFLVHTGAFLLGTFMADNFVDTR